MYEAIKAYLSEGQEREMRKKEEIIERVKPNITEPVSLNSKASDDGFKFVQ